MTKILWIDDERNPWGRLGDMLNLPKDDIVWAKTSFQALRVLKGRPFKHIFFDHDLGGDDNTLIVAQAMAELVFHEVCTPEEIVEGVCFIHTQNPVGRDSLHRILQRWGFFTKDVWL